MTSDDPFALVGTRLEGRYDIDAVVAHGGFGVVYRGCHRAIDRPIALKVLKVPDTLSAPLQAAFVEGFVREAKLLVKVDHPAVVRVLDVGVMTAPDGREAPWMALEWVEGVNLSDWLAARRGRGGMTPAEALSLLLPVAEALVEAQALGVVHRDLKPSNIRLTLDRNAPTALGDPAHVTSVRLLDFGIAKVMEGDDAVGSGVTSTHSALLAFSIAYAAPEQVSAARTGPWTDVHGLALLMTELLTDAPPFRGATRMEIHAAVMSIERPTPARANVDVGPLETVLAKALSLRPPERHATVAELLAAMQAAIQSPTLPPRRSRATARRLPTYPASFPTYSEPTEEPATLPLGVLIAPSVPPTEPVVAARSVAAPPPPPRPSWSRAVTVTAVLAALVSLVATLAVLHRSPPPPQPRSSARGSATTRTTALAVTPPLTPAPPTAPPHVAPPTPDAAPPVTAPHPTTATRRPRRPLREFPTFITTPPPPPTAPTQQPLRVRMGDLHDPWQ